RVNTILVVTWDQVTPSAETWLEFTFESGNVMTSRRVAGAVGAHRDVVLGAPTCTAVTVRIMNTADGATHATSDYVGITKWLPAGLPVPQVLDYDPDLASPDRWLFGAVEDSAGG